MRQTAWRAVVAKPGRCLILALPSRYCLPPASAAHRCIAALRDFTSRLVGPLARPISLEEELTEAFRFFKPANPGEVADDDEEDEMPELDVDHAVITKKGLAKIFAEMGEEVTEEECLDMIAAATGGMDTIDFSTFESFCQPGAAGPRRRSVNFGG